MALSYAAVTMFKDADRGVAQISVQSSRCCYKVIVTTEEVILRAPGVNEELERNLALSFEGQAILSVVEWEET